MSGAAHPPANYGAVALKATALGAIVGVAALVNHLAPAEVSFAAPVAALGLFLLVGDLLAEVVERFGLPHLSGYLLAGVIVGPHGLGTVSEATVGQLSLVNTLALALIALSAGGELTLNLLRKGLLSMITAAAGQVLLLLPVCAGAFFLLRPWLPFLDGYAVPTVVGAALLWGVLALPRSPSATLGLIAQFRPDGPLTRYALSLVIAFDIVVLILFAVALQAARTLSVPGAAFDVGALYTVGEELVGSIAAGTTLGLLVALYLRLVGRQLILFLVVVSYGVTQFSAYFNYDSLLLFVIAGFIVANISPHGGEKLLEAVSQGGRVVYVLFFANAGAHLDLPLLAAMWPIALTLAATRIGMTFVSTRLTSRIAKDPEPVRRYGWMTLISQAGVTIGMSVILARMFPDSFGPGMQSLVVAVVGINELVGPVLFKLALDRTGETGKALPAQGGHGGHGDHHLDSGPATVPTPHGATG